MKNSIKNSAKNNSLSQNFNAKFVNFQAIAIDSDKQKMVKGGSDIITQDVVMS